MTKNIVSDFLYEKESKLIYEACSEVWKKFGGDFKESIVNKALTIALKKKNLFVEDQKRVEIFFDEKKVGTYIIDKVIDNKIMIETKCKEFLTKEDERQFWRYLKATNYKLGFLINFSPKRVEIKRRIYDKARKFVSVS